MGKMGTEVRVPILHRRRWRMQRAFAPGLLLGLLLAAGGAQAGRILFIGNRVLFGSLTGKDPRSLGKAECSGFELGLSAAQVGALEQVAFDQLAAEGAMTAAAPSLESNPTVASKCSPARLAPSMRPKGCDDLFFCAGQIGLGLVADDGQ